MSAWACWAVILGGLGIWLGIGFGIVGPRWITAHVEEHLREFPTLDSAAELESERRFARSMCWGPALIWPLAFVVLLSRWSASRSRLTRHELEVRIAELEREAGLR